MDATVCLQSEKVITSSLVYGQLKRLLYNAKIHADNAQDFASDAAIQLILEIEFCFGRFLTQTHSDFDPYFVLCALLDPNQTYFLADFQPTFIGATLAKRNM